jgi:hypothetical protein
MRSTSIQKTLNPISCFQGTPPPMTRPISSTRPVLKALLGSASVVALSIGLAGHAAAQEVEYDYLTAPIVASSNQTGAIFQEQTGDVLASITSGTAGSDLEPSASAVSTQTDDNTMRATATGNTSTALVDTALASGTAGNSNGVLASALEVRGAAVTANVSASSISTTVDTPADGSSVSLSGNTMAAETVLSSATNILQGDINLGFANTDPGSVDVDITASTLDVVADSTAGYLLQSSQVNTSVASGLAYAGVSSSNITLTLDDTETTPATLSDLNIDIQDNTASADFTANMSDNLLNLQGGALTTLSGAAGLSNVQVNEDVGEAGSYVNLTAQNFGLGVTATVAAGLSLADSSLAMTDNAMSASSTLSTATNQLVVADGISVDGPTPYLSGDNVQLNAGAASPAATVTASDIFLSNTQAAVQSSSYAFMGQNTMTLTANAVSGSDISATGNTMTVSADGNTATSNLQVAGATSLNAMVAGTNLQTFSATTTEALGDRTPTVKATTDDSRVGMAMNVARTAGEAVTGSSLGLDANQVSADAQINTSSLSVGVTGTSVSDGQAVSDEVAPVIAGGASIATVTSGFSATSVQSATGETGDTDYSVRAMIYADGEDTLSLSVGNASVMSDSTLSLSDNTVAADAGLNDAVTRLDVAANTLDTSLALTSVQQGDAGVYGFVGSPLRLALTVDASGGAADGLSLSADANQLTGTASGNTATNVMTVQATTQAVTNAVVSADPAASRTNLSNGASGTTPDLFAEMSLLNLQTSSTLSAIDARVRDVGVVATLAAGALTDSTLSVDGNLSQVTASANTATNMMEAEIGSFDLTDAVRDSDGDTNQAGGTSIAALGSNQNNTSAVTALMDYSGNGGANYQAEITGNAARDGVTVSADSNQRIASASGNSATNMFDLSGTAIVTPEANAPVPILSVSSTTTLADVEIDNAAFAIGNVQQNTGAITSTLSAGLSAGTDTISAKITTTAGVTGSAVTVDANRALARADAISATTDVTLDAANIQTSALVGSAQRNTGNVLATAGDANSEIAFIVAVPTGTQTNTVLSASQNVAGAVANGISGTSDLAIGGDTTASVLGSSTALVAPSLRKTGVSQLVSDSVIADYAVASTQFQSGSVTASAASLLVDVDANDFVGGAVNADRNLLTAQATGASASSSVDVAGGDLGSSGYAPVIAASNNQSFGGQVSGGQVYATVSDAAVLVDVADLNASTAGESVSIDANTILAQASGATATTSLSAAAGAGAGTVFAGNLWEGGRIESNIEASGNRALVSNQAGLAGGDVTALVDGAPSLDMTIAGAIAGDTLSLTSNTVQATAGNLAAINTLSNTAGTSLEAAASLASRQAALGTTSATVDDASAVIGSGSTAAGSSITLSSNDVKAGATGVSATNTLTSAAGTMDGSYVPTLDLKETSSDRVNSTAHNSLLSYQAIEAAVSAAVSGETEILVDVTGAVTGSSVAMDANLVEASATAGTVTNRLTQSSDAGTTAGSSAILASDQLAAAAAVTSSTVTGAQIASSAASLSGSSVSADANSVQAVTTGLSAGNVLDVSAGTDLASDAPYNTLDVTSGLLSGAMANMLSNRQTIGASTLSANIDAAAAETAAAGDGATITVDIAGDIGAGSSASLSSNMMRALVTGASASNIASAIAGTASTTSVALVNDQDVAATLQAGIDQPSITVTAANLAGNSSIDVSSNVIVSAATAASATNQVRMDAGTGISGGSVGTVQLTAAPELGAYTDGAAETVATLLNGQASSGTVTSTVGGDATIGEPNMSVALSGAVTGTVAVEDNTLLSQSRGNVATNAVSLSAGSTIDATSQGVLASTQDRSGAINASITGSSTGSRGTIGITSAGAVDGSLSVDNNMVRASGAANTVLNSFTVNGGGSAGAPTGAALNAGTMSSNAQYAALNAQTNASSVTSSVSNFNMGLTNGTNGVTGMASLTGNTVMADATGNSAYNVMTITSGIDTYGTASMANNQSNSASMSAQISGVSMTMDMGAAGAGGAASLRNSGNAITANAVGNTATTIMTRTR